MKTLGFFFILLFPFIGYSQVQKPVEWNIDVLSAKGDTLLVQIKAQIDSGWHIYSQKQNIVNGPIATSFKFNASNEYALLGETVEGTPITKLEAAYNNMEVLYFEDDALFSQKLIRKSHYPFIITSEVTFMVCSEEMCLPPETIELTVSVPQVDSVGTSSLSATPESGNLGIWAIFFAGFAGGLLALLTPCVFPMLPLTVSFFTKQSKTRAKGLTNALIYAASIVVIYVVLGLSITLLLGADALNAMASNGIVNLSFFVIFVIFAISFFGAFEIRLPNKWLNASDNASDKGGLIGIFFMAFTLSLVSFSCTGPIIGSLLVQAAVNGDVAGPAMGMLGFSSALALPFALFAAFPGWLNSLPKSGGWLNSVKVVLGFIELALALKFLSSVDLAYHWGFLTRELFLALWIVIFSLLGFYLLGKIRLPHDSEQKHTSVSGLLLGVIVLSFVVYLIPGMWGAPLKMISGFPPPSFYNEGWNQQSNSSQPKQENGTNTQGELHCPLNLNCFHDYDKGLAYAKRVNKPIILDFTGWSCVNCRKMEDNVWSDKTVWNILNSNYVLISLYVDDKTDLPLSEQYISPTTGKTIKTVGNKWSDFQTTRYKTNSQPYYVLLNNSEQILAPIKGYDTNINNYINFLELGISSFKKNNKDLSGFQISTTN